MEYFEPFVQASFRLTSKHRENPAQSYQVYLDFTLELPLRGLDDRLIAIPVTGVNIGAAGAQPAKTFSIVCSTRALQTPTIPVYEFDPRADHSALQALFGVINAANPRVYQSLWFNIPPTTGDNPYNALAIFIMPESNLGAGLTFGLLLSGQLKPAKSNNPDKLWGQTPGNTAENGVRICLSKPPHKPSQYQIQATASANPQFDSVAASVEAAAFYVDPTTLQQAPLAADGILDVSAEQIQKDLAQFLDAQKFEPKNEQDLQKWQLLARELAQKQEIIHRMMRENDEKNQSLKLATSEVVDLRRTLKMMQSENAILRKQMANEEASQLQNLVAKEIASMSNEELKLKVIKLAQAYRSERIRNEYFEKALKSANVDLA